MLLAVVLDPTCTWKVPLACNLNASHVLHLQSRYIFHLLTHSTATILSNKKFEIFCKKLLSIKHYNNIYA